MKRKSSGGMGCWNKRKPAAERQREFIIGWIGPMPGPKGRDFRLVSQGAKLAKSLIHVKR